MNGNNKTRKRKRQMELQSFKYERLFYDENNGIPTTAMCSGWRRTMCDDHRLNAASNLETEKGLKE